MKKLTFLVASVSGVGHTFACVGTMTPFLEKGHRVVFFIEEPFRGKLAAKGFEEYVYNTNIQNGHDGKDNNPAKQVAKTLFEFKIVGPGTIEEKISNVVRLCFGSEWGKLNVIQSDKCLKEAIEKINPDCFVVDSENLLPSIYYSGKPWIKHISTGPLHHYIEEDLPPSSCGFAEDSDPKEWSKYHKLKMGLRINKDLSGTLKRMGYEPYPGDYTMPNTQIITVFACAQEMSFPQFDQKWFNIEVFNRNKAKEVFDLKQTVPEDFLNDTLDGRYSGKLIYVSMGSMGSIDLNLMKRLVSALKNTKHKYIISKGPLHTEYQLERNMWGQDFLPQIQILPIVDLVITHAGNNTLTETIAQGKPMVAMPLFGDQYDNAQRLHEKKLGIRLDPYTFTEQELIDSIEKIFEDKELHERLEKISNRIQTSNLHQEFCLKVEQLLQSL